MGHTCGSPMENLKQGWLISVLLIGVSFWTASRGWRATVIHWLPPLDCGQFQSSVGEGAQVKSLRPLQFGIPQASDLSIILFNFHTRLLGKVIQWHSCTFVPLASPGLTNFTSVSLVSQAMLPYTCVEKCKESEWRGSDSNSNLVRYSGYLILLVLLMCYL